MKRTILVMSVLAFAGCATPIYVTNWSQINQGMTQPEVRDLLGEPHSVSAPFNPKIVVTTEGTIIPPELINEGAKLFFGALFDRTHERWIYGQDSILGAPTKGFAVYFDDQGHVIGYRRPTKGRFRNLPKKNIQLAYPLKSSPRL